MKLCHFVTVAPNRCGLYATAKDLINAEKMAGIEAGVIDADVAQREPLYNGRSENWPKAKDDIDIRDMKWALGADAYIRHSLFPTCIQNLGKPLVMAVHGRPESSVRLEDANIIPVIETYYKRGADKRYKAFTVFWQEYMQFWSTIIPKEKLYYIPAPVDLQFYAPFGKPYQFGKDNGSPNILVCDIWRDDVIPLNVILAALKFQQLYCKTAKIHILALQGNMVKTMKPILKGMRDAGALGVVCGQIREIKDFYAAADMVVTPHVIATRTVREPLACGVPVVAGSGNKYTPYTGNPMDVDSFAKAINNCWQDLKDDGATVREYARQMAEKCFNPKRTGEAMKEMLNKII